MGGGGVGGSPQGWRSTDADLLQDSAVGMPPLQGTPVLRMSAPLDTNGLATAQDLPIPERLPDVTAAATRGPGAPASGLKHGSPSQAPQEVRVRTTNHRADLHRSCA